MAEDSPEWDPAADEDVALTVQRALRLPAPPQLIRPEHQGCDMDTYFVGADKDKILRVAPDEEAAEKLQRDMRVRELVRKHLRAAATARAAAADPASEASTMHEDVIARCIATGVVHAGGERERAFCIDERLYGTSLDEAPATARTEADLAALLRVLNGIPIDEVRRDAHLEEREDVDFESLASEARAAFERLRDRSQLPASLHGVCVPSQEALEDAARRAHDRRVLLHADLKGEHILVDPDGSGRVTGVLDWADAEIGLPDDDVEDLAQSVGAPMAARIATLAGYDEGTVERGVLSARCQSLLMLDDELNSDGEGSPVGLLRMQLELAFEPWR